MTTKEIVKDARLLARNPQTKGDERVARWVLRHAPVVVAAKHLSEASLPAFEEKPWGRYHKVDVQDVGDLIRALAAAEESADELLSPVEGEPQQEVEDG